MSFDCVVCIRHSRPIIAEDSEDGDSQQTKVQPTTVEQETPRAVLPPRIRQNFCGCPRQAGATLSTFQE
ncbi:hypothetical protein MRX96_044392 [Rhipicephalus microplus]